MKNKINSQNGCYKFGSANHHLFKIFDYAKGDNIIKRRSLMDLAQLNYEGQANWAEVAGTKTCLVALRPRCNGFDPDVTRHRIT